VHLSCLAQLALVAGIDVAFDVLLKRWPPESVSKGMVGGIETFVSQFIVGIMEESGALRCGNVELVPPLVVLSPELSVSEKETLGILKELSSHTII
jgi:hypothetical protein